MLTPLARSFGRAELDPCAVCFERARAAEGAAHAALAALADAFNGQRAVAEKRLRDLVIHREAAGSRRNQALYELWPMPPRLKLS